jgi:hypothetical protein
MVWLLDDYDDVEHRAYVMIEKKKLIKISWIYMFALSYVSNV